MKYNFTKNSTIWEFYLYLHWNALNVLVWCMKVSIADDDLKELIETGHNNKYKKYSKDKRFMEGLARAYKIMLVVEKAEGLKTYSFLHYEQLRNNLDLSSVRVVNGRV